MMDITKSREDFEKQFPIPKHVIRCGTGYAVTSYGAWEANSYLDLWKGWLAGRESIEKKAPPKIENHMSQPIAVLDISSRTKNAILNGGILTIGDLLRIGHLGVLKVPGIGRGCEAEIKSALANLSIEWKPWGESE